MTLMGQWKGPGMGGVRKNTTQLCLGGASQPQGDLLGFLYPQETPGTLGSERCLLHRKLGTHQPLSQIVIPLAPKLSC